MKRLSVVFVVLVALISSMCFSGCSDGYKSYETTVFSSDIPMTVELYGNDCYGEMKAFADKLNGLINPDIPSSDVARFNAMERGSVEVDEITYNLVITALLYNEMTQGAFDITLTPLSKLWRVDAENIFLSHDHDLPSIEALTEHRSYISEISVSEQNGKFYLVKNNEQATIDLGGIAKGYLTDELASIAKRNGVKSAIVNVGGNISLVGNRIKNGEENKWKIGVNDCFSYGYICGLLTGEASVVTSGTYERYYEKDGVKYCHIINPSTLMPTGVTVENGAYANEKDYVISCTVLSSSATACDVMATAVCVLGKNAGLEMLERNGVKALIITADKKYATCGEIEFIQGDFPLNEMEKYE